MLQPLRYDEERRIRLGQHVQLHREGAGQPDLEGAGVDPGRGFDRLREKLTVRIALDPALQTLQAVGRLHGCAVMEGEPVAQLEAPALAVRRNLVALDHLRLRLAGEIEPVERVVDIVAVVAGHGRRRPDRIERGEIGLRHEILRGGRLAAARPMVAGPASVRAGAPFRNVRRLMAVSREIDRAGIACPRRDACLGRSCPGPGQALSR